MPLEHAAPGTKGFENNIREMAESGHPQKQAIAAAYNAARGDAGAPFATGPSPINQSAHPIDRVLAEAEKFYTRMDSVTRDCGRMDAAPKSETIRIGNRSFLIKETGPKEWRYEAGINSMNASSLSSDLAREHLIARLKQTYG